MLKYLDVHYQLLILHLQLVMLKKILFHHQINFLWQSKSPKFSKIIVVETGFVERS